MKLTSAIADVSTRLRSAIGDVNIKLPAIFTLVPVQLKPTETNRNQHGAVLLLRITTLFRISLWLYMCVYVVNHHHNSHTHIHTE